MWNQFGTETIISKGHLLFYLKLVGCTCEEGKNENSSSRVYIK